MKRILLLIAMVSPGAFAATFLVPSDETLVRASKAIVLATAGESYSRFAPGGWIETVTSLHVDESIKGPIASGDTIKVTELGGEVGSIAYLVAGSPRYVEGERVLLFLETNDRGEWVSKNMAIGKFSFAGGLLVRDSSEIIGWDVDTRRPHREPQRDGARFLRFVRAVAAGRTASPDYALSAQALRPAPAAAPASTYCMTISGLPVRWDRFPTAVTFLSNGSQPGALNGGLTALQRAFAAWSGDPGSNIVYQYGGITGARSGFAGPDGINSVQFNDPSNEIPGSFQLQNGATLAIGGVWAGSDTHTYNGETFRTISEADLVIQDGISGPGLTGNGFDHVVTHELGHTLGIRHSDDPPPGGTSSTQAVMNSSVDFNNDVIGSSLQAWDIEAIVAVYGGGGGGVTPPPCNAPSITAQPQPVSIINTPANISVSATGDAPLQYQWYIGASGNKSQPIPNANAALLTIQPSVTTQYWVQVTNKCGVANSDTATVTVNGCPAVSINFVSPSTLIIEGRQTTLTADATGGTTLKFEWFIGNPGTTTVPAGTGPSITVRPDITTNYWVRVTNNCGAFADSDVVVITVQPCNAPSVVIQPSSGDVLSGTSVTLFVADTGTQPETYQWFEGVKGDATAPVESASLPSFKTPPLQGNTSYWVRITNDCGTTDSETAHLHVVGSCSRPSIVSQPQNESINSGSSATLSVGVTGTSLSYQWYQGLQLDRTHPVGGDSPTLITPVLSASTPFWVRVTSPCGIVNSTTATVSTSSRRRPSRG